jgi:Cullin family
MQRAFAHFVAFYHTLHAGRRVDLRTAMGSVEISATFGGVGLPVWCLARIPISVSASFQVNKILIGPTILASLLDEFNRHEVRTFEQLLVATEIPENELNRLLKSVSMGKSKHRIMVRRGIGNEIGMSSVMLDVEAADLVQLAWFRPKRRVPHQRRLHFQPQASHDPSGLEWSDKQAGGRPIQEGGGGGTEARDRSRHRSSHEGQADYRA